MFDPITAIPEPVPFLQNVSGWDIQAVNGPPCGFATTVQFFTKENGNKLKQAIAYAISPDIFSTGTQPQSPTCGQKWGNVS